MLMLNAAIHFGKCTVVAAFALFAVMTPVHAATIQWDFSGVSKRVTYEIAAAATHM